MRFFKYLIFLVLTLFSINVFAETFYKVEYDDSSVASSGSAACSNHARNKKYNDGFVYSSHSYDPGRMLCTVVAYHKDNQFYDNSTLQVVKFENQCEAGKTVYLDGYITKPDGFPPDQVCSNGCQYTKESDGLAFDTSNGNLNWGFDAKNTGQQCDVETDKGEDTPQDPKMDECKNSNGSDAYCPKDPNKKCPDGYKEQMFNDEKLCVKEGDPNDPSSSQPTDPNDPSASQPTDPNDPTASQPGTGGGTDLSGVISAIKAMGSSITAAINSLSKTLTDAINKNGRNTVDAIDKNTAELKKGNGFLEQIKDWLFNDELPSSTDNKVVTDSDLLEDNQNTFRFGPQCPAPVTEQISIIGYSWTFSFSFESYCTVLARLAPYFVFSAYLAAAFIIAGVRDA